MSAPTLRRTGRTEVPAPRRRGRHAAADPATPPPAPARVEATQPMPARTASAERLRVRLPFPEAAGQLIHHPKTGAWAVSCNTRGLDSPEAHRFPCYAVISGHSQHGMHMWLTYREALHTGWTQHTADVRTTS